METGAPYRKSLDTVYRNIVPFMSELKKRREDGNGKAMVSLPKSLIEDGRKLADELGLPFSTVVGVALLYLIYSVKVWEGGK